jgi:hypothetical protein
MTLQFQDFAEFQGLLDALCEETITAEQMHRLEELVLAHPEAEAYYVQYMSLFADLSRHFVASAGATEQSLRGRLAEKSTETERQRTIPLADSPSPASRSHRRMRFILWGSLVMAAGLLLALALSWPRPAEDSRGSNYPEEPFDNSVAVLLNAHAAVWEESDLPTRVGAPLPRGWLHLKSGIAQIEFYSGAMVILKGPADFKLISRKEAYCSRGNLWATVPPQAHGFTIGSPHANLVDRGTEFGFQVGDKTEVHVFKGKVEMYSPGPGRKAAPHKDLTTGQGVRLDGPDDIRPIEVNPAAFQTPQKLADLAQEETRLQQKNWLAASEALRKDPSLVVYYPFQAENTWSRTLFDQAGERKNPHDGAVVGCSWVTGRWPGKQGLEFKRVSDRVRFHVPGQFDSLTLLVWVRVDALPNRYSSLMMTDGWDDAAPHWHIFENGKIQLGVQGPNQTGGVRYYAPKVFTPERLGQWVQLAVVYDGNDRKVTHYVDGQQVSQDSFRLDTPLRIGDAEIGNWNVASFAEKYPVRYFSGCMDEFMLFSRALSEREIEQLYSQGRPPL